jgi:hypothetical protein
MGIECDMAFCTGTPPNEAKEIIQVTAILLVIQNADAPDQLLLRELGRISVAGRQ